MRRREKFPHSRRCPGSPRETLPAMYSPCASPSGTTDRPMRIPPDRVRRDRKSTRLNSSHSSISYAVFCLKKKKKKQIKTYIQTQTNRTTPITHSSSQTHHHNIILPLTQITSLYDSYTYTHTLKQSHQHTQ